MVPRDRKKTGEKAGVKEVNRQIREGGLGGNGAFPAHNQGAELLMRVIGLWLGRGSCGSMLRVKLRGPRKAWLLHVSAVGPTLVL